MTTTTLAYFPSPAQGVWHLGPIPIRAYALFIIAGIVVALVIGDRRWAARGGERGVIYDIALWAVPFGLLGGRLYHVLTDWKTYFGDGGAGPVAALRIWDGGLGIWGAVALGGVGAWVACRRRGIPLPAFGDAIAPGIVLAQAIGRLGNYFNQELYGRETTVPWGMEVFYRRDPSGIIDVHSLNGVSTGQVAAVVHPTFLYELIWNVLVFVALIYIDRRFRIGHGRLFALYVAGYCVGRFGVELMRDDFATHIAGIRINSFTATFVFIGAVVYFILAPKGREDPATLGGRPEGEESLAEELTRDLAAVAATSGVVAAATVAGREDGAGGGASDAPPAEADEPEAATQAVNPPTTQDPVAGSAADEDALAEVTAEAVPEPATDADDVEAEPEDEALLEAEVAGTGVETETAAVAEDADLIDEDHDPVDEEDLESLSDEVAVVAGEGPVSEQQEELTASPADDAEEPDVESGADTDTAEEPDEEPGNEAEAADDVTVVAEADAQAEQEPAADEVAVEADEPGTEADAQAEEEPAVDGEAASEEPESETKAASEEPESETDTASEEPSVEAADEFASAEPDDPPRSGLGRLLRRRR